MQRKNERERGSATIEATISLTVFIFFTVAVMSIVNYCRAQMLISNAADAVAKEISQYSYLYAASGLKKYNEKVGGNSENAKDAMNNVIDTAQKLLTIVSDGAESAAAAAGDALDNSGNIDIGSLIEMCEGLESGGAEAYEAFNALSGQIGDIMENPVDFMRGIVSVASSEGLSLVKSHLIAAPLARAMFVKHFGGSKAEANDALLVLGIKGGLDGLNFSLSTMFEENAYEDINVVVYYKINLIQLMNIDLIDVTIRKSSYARAWLGGDDF